MLFALIVLAAGYGAAVGLLVPRAVYRLAVEPDAPWRDSCPSGHPLTGPAGGWLGPARCGACGGVFRGQASGLPDALRAGPPLPDGPRIQPVRRLGTGFWGGAPGATPAVAGLTAAVCAALAGAVGFAPELGVWLLLAPFFVLLALVDRAVQRLPDVLTLPLAAAAAVLLGGVALLPGARGSWPLALLGGLALGGGYLVLFLVNPNGMGFGDVKLAIGLGVALGWYGWGVLMPGALAGFVYGAGYGFVLVLRGRAGRRTAMPFGPFMVAGAFTGMLLGGLGA
ncbi:A24 family peptidase [Streptomyces sannanensis]|uniref:A24 family peptidase n=1 Tax=Streptomyces sannanensis TaxID=285536 RepID=A0ABP6SF34_9ACTN